EVALVDGGVRGLGLVPIIKEAEDLIIIDAVRKGQAPGTLYRLTDEDLCARVNQKNSLHQVDLIEALTVAQAFGEAMPSIIVLGVEPLDVSPWGMELTPIIEARVDELVALVIEELGRLGVKCQPGLEHDGL
ncbi:MAG: hydrogenase maturation protease, partial [Deltaproteobacteria bacterium]|nr:hydrogenase maturation protease [Deltaproteobacteria bacterium]